MSLLEEIGGLISRSPSPACKPPETRHDTAERQNREVKKDGEREAARLLGEGDGGGSGEAQRTQAGTENRVGRPGRLSTTTSGNW